MPLLRCSAVPLDPYFIALYATPSKKGPRVTEPPSPVSGRPNPRPLLILLIALSILTALRLWMLSAQTLYVPNSGADDALFLQEATTIKTGYWMGHKTGHWLGDYNQMRLVKGPGYPLFVAAASTLHVPILTAQHLFCMFAYWVLIFALRPVIRSIAALVLIFAFLSFNPVNVGYGSWFLLRDAIYPEQCILAAACLFAVATRLRARYRVQWGWGISAGLALGWVYISREEGVWIAPVVALMLLYTAMVAWKLRQTIGKWNFLAVPAVPLAVMGVVVLSVCIMNWRHYRMFGVVEFKERNFTAAMGAASRVTPSTWQPMVPVQREIWQKLYEVSPAFRELKPFLEGKDELGNPQLNIGDYWAKISGDATANVKNSTQGTREIAGGWWIWAFRDAVAAAGHYRKDYRDTRAFYRRMADQINAAVDSGKLPGGPKRDSISPPFRREYLPLMWEQFPRLWFELVHMHRQIPYPELFYSQCDNATLQRYADFLHETVIPNDPTVAPDWPEVTYAQRAYQSGIRAKPSLFLYYRYHKMGPYVFALAVIAFLLLLLIPRFRRSDVPLLIFIVGVFMAVVLRSALLLYLDVSSFPAADNPRYISAAQTYLLLAEALALGGLVNAALPILVARIRFGKRAA